jgi:hypothetical protein
MSRPSRRPDQEVPRLTPEQLREFEERRARIAVSDDPEDVLTPDDAARLLEAERDIAAGRLFSLDDIRAMLNGRATEGDSQT